MDRVILGVEGSSVYVYDGELGYEVPFSKQQIHLLLLYGAVTGAGVIKENARQVLKKVIRHRVYSNGLISYLYTASQSIVTVSDYGTALGAFSVVGNANLVFNDSVTFVHKLAFCHEDCNVTIDCSSCSPSLKRQIHRAGYSAGSITINDYDDCHELYGTEFLLLGMDSTHLRSELDTKLLSLYKSSISSIGSLGSIDWGLDYDLGEFSPYNKRIIHFLQEVVPSKIEVSDTYRFMVGYFLSEGADKSVGVALKRYLFGG